MTRLALACAATLLTAACGARVTDDKIDAPRNGGDGGNGDGGNSTSDARPTDAGLDAPPDAMPCTGSVVYLDFDGITLSKSATTDATMNATSWQPNATAVIPAFRPTDANRTAEIAALVTSLEHSLGAFPVAIVTHRPVTAPYILVAIGGSEATNVGFATAYAAYSGFDCGNVTPNDVVWATDTLDTQDTADFIVGGVGLAVGLTGTTDGHDCMCSWGGAVCTPLATACTLSASIASKADCTGEIEPQDEVAAFHSNFCQ